VIIIQDLVVFLHCTNYRHGYVVSTYILYGIRDVQLRMLANQTNYKDMGRLEISLTFILPEFMINLRFSEAMVEYYLNTI